MNHTLHLHTHSIPDIAVQVASALEPIDVADVEVTYGNPVQVKLTCDRFTLEEAIHLLRKHFNCSVHIARPRRKIGTVAL
jgi:hypothetical protein